MVLYSGWEYLLIDLANHFGLDKLLFEERIEWANNNLHQLEALADKADKKPLYMKAVLTIRKVLNGEPTGHLVGLDACCSGLQIMSVLTGCIKGATATGLVDPNVRSDAYTELNEVMKDILGVSTGVSRNDSKDAYMKSLYGSKAEPKKIFGEDTPELAAFYEAASIIGPGAWILLQELLDSWQPHALVHAWKLPDGYDARIKVMVDKDARIEIDELDHTSFTYNFAVNEPEEKGRANAANVIHSVDAYILRCIQRRCNYDEAMANNAYDVMMAELSIRQNHSCTALDVKAGTKLAYYIEQYNRSGIADVVILPYVNDNNVHQLSTQHLEGLTGIVFSMLKHKPFPVVTVHDEFKCGGNHMNHLRQHYINIFAELAESELLADILSQIHGVPGTYTKLNNNLGQLIRGSNYALS
jgi:hypothetical protein